MTNTEQRKTAYIIFRLLEYYLEEGIFPDAAYDEELRSDLFRFACRHGVVAVIADALQKGGVTDPRFRSAEAMAIRRSLLYHREFGKVSNGLEEAGVRYLPLKGIILKKLYPNPLLREMSDIDLLMDDASAERAKSVMQKLGYRVKSFRGSNHDVYSKEPMFCFEIHRSLVDRYLFPNIDKALEGIEDRLVPDNGGYRMRATVEDVYLMVILHAFKHYITGGMGMRVLVDIRLYLKKYTDSMDWNFITQKLRIAGAEEFEKKIRVLSHCFTAPDSLADEQRDFLDEFILYGLYGSKKLATHRRLTAEVGEGTKRSKMMYLRKRLTVPKARIERSRFFSKHRRLVPLLAVYRPIKSVFTRPKKLLQELKALRNYHADGNYK